MKICQQNKAQSDKIFKKCNEMKNKDKVAIEKKNAIKSMSKENIIFLISCHSLTVLLIKIKSVFYIQARSSFVVVILDIQH